MKACATVSRRKLTEKAYEAYQAEDFDELDLRTMMRAGWITAACWPDPDQARVRVYATQSTHKTLTSLRQGSMIHVHDQDYKVQGRGTRSTRPT